MRFLDSSVFLHAYLKPKRELKLEELEIKRRAKNIIKRIDDQAEEITTTVVHISEIANIIEAHLGLEESINLIGTLLALPNIQVLDVKREDYESAAILAMRYKISINDAIAYLKMLENNINEIYSFDKHFQNLPGIKRVEE